MNIQIRPMTAEGARQIADWRYAGELARYDLRDPSLLLADGYYEATDGRAFIGFFCFGAEARVPGYDYGVGCVDFGLGLRPDLVGRGFGRAFCERGLALLDSLYPGARARLTVADGHIPAIRAYTGAGFAAVDAFESFGGMRFVVMEYAPLRWLDISAPLDNGMRVYPGDVPFERTSEVTDWGMISRFSMSAHCGTHVDAPAHFLPGGTTVEAMDVARMNGDCLVLALDELAGTPLLTRRLLLKAQRGLTAAEARLLAAAELWLLGVDRMSPAPSANEGEVHRILLGAGICLLENLQLADVRPGNYELSCLPLSLRGCEGAPARAFLKERTGGIDR